MNLLTPERSRRYERNVLLKGVGVQGQETLLKSKVLVVGVGGLGSPAAYYLAAAGVGRIGLMDGDAVDLPNLQRQILHSTRDLGKPKVESAKEKLLSLNPDVSVDAHDEPFTEENAPFLVPEYDIVLDCTDNFPTRFAINDICVKTGKPFVYGGVVSFSGQVTTIVPGKGPCLRCIFPAEPRDNPSNPSQSGVLGTVPGVIGVIQATEALKYLLNMGDLLVGRLLVYHARGMNFYEVEFRQNPECPACGNG